MKRGLFMLFLILFCFQSQAQFSKPYRATLVHLKNGKTLQGKGKVKNRGFKFKQGSDKPYFINFDSIAYLQERSSHGEVKTFFFFETNDDYYDYVKVELLIEGSNLQLYASIFDTNTATAGGGSFNETVVSYYIKKPEETKLTYFGPYSPIGNNLKYKVLNYFKDCPELIEKIENKDFRMRDGLEPIVEFYIDNCNKP